MNVNLPPFLLEKSSPAAGDPRGHIRYAYLERGIAGIAAMIRECFFDPSCLSGRGWLRKIDARVKVVFLVFFIVLISIKTRIESELAIAAVLAALAVFSGVGVARFCGRVLRYTFLFGLVVTFPAMFNIVTPGDMLLPVIELARPHQWWLYHVPREIGITSQGLHAVCLLNLRILNSIAAASLIVQTTPFNDIMKAMKVFRVPETLLLIVTLSHKYIFILARTIDDMFSRPEEPPGRRRRQRRGPGLGCREAGHPVPQEPGAVRGDFPGHAVPGILRRGEAQRLRAAGRSQPAFRLHLSHGGVYLAMDMKDIIRVEGVRFGYSDRIPALDDISLSVGEKDRFAVIGSNGTGKSSLLKIMNGLLKPARGRSSSGAGN